MRAVQIFAIVMEGGSPAYQSETRSEAELSCEGKNKEVTREDVVTLSATEFMRDEIIAMKMNKVHFRLRGVPLLLLSKRI